MKTLYFDCSNGISGDMVLKALTDIADCEQEILAAMEAEEFSHMGQHHEHDHHHDHDHHDHHAHGRSYSEVKKLIKASHFTPKSKEYALNIYGHIAKAESTVHGETPETIHFHEVGRDGAIKNALGIGMALERIAADKIITSDIYDGSGTIVCSHGEIPVPVPAVMALRDDSSFVFKEAQVQTEMVTPSGLASLMGIGAEAGNKPEGDIISQTEAKGSRDTGRGGLRVYVFQEEAMDTNKANSDMKSNANSDKNVNKIMDKDPITNPILKEAIAAAKEDSGKENSVRLLNEVVRAKLLAPVSMDKTPEYEEETGEMVLEKDTQISFELIAADNGDLYYPVFTDGEELAKCDVEENQHNLIVNFDDLAAMLLQPQNAVAGFVINPMSDNICFSTEMVAAMKDDMAKGPVKKTNTEGSSEDEVPEDLDDFQDSEAAEEEN